MPNIKNGNPLYEKYIQDGVEGYTTFFFNSLKDKNWISLPANIELARNKILQLNYAKEVGLSMPNTLITTSIDSFKLFYEENKGNVIIKSIKGRWYNNMGGEDYLFFTNMIDSLNLPTRKSLEQSPCLFQEYIKKEFELRATVVGNKVFTTALYSQENENSKIDWRMATDKVKHLPYEPSEELEKQLIGINGKFGLNFGAYDLIMTPEGKPVFLELNPNGQWGWVQEKTGLKIRESLTDFLIHGKN